MIYYASKNLLTNQLKSGWPTGGENTIALVDVNNI